MIAHFDHGMICVRNMNAAKRCIGLPGFEENKPIVISGNSLGFAV